MLEEDYVYSDSEPRPGPSGIGKSSVPKLKNEPEVESDGNSTSDSEISAYSDRFQPLKALYSERIILPVPNAPIYENLQQFEAAMNEHGEILAVGMGQQVLERERRKTERKLAYEKAVEDINRRRFANYEVPVKPERREARNVLTRLEAIEGPLAAIRRAMNEDLRVKVVTRGPRGVRGELHATVTAFDKHWNLVLTNVLEVYRKKVSKKRKVPPAGGSEVPQGTADMISPIPIEVETPVGNGVLECVRHIPQILVRGEHIVLINIVEQ